MRTQTGPQIDQSVFGLCLAGDFLSVFRDSDEPVHDQRLKILSIKCVRNGRQWLDIYCAKASASKIPQPIVFIVFLLNQRQLLLSGTAIASIQQSTCALCLGDYGKCVDCECIHGRSVITLAYFWRQSTCLCIQIVQGRTSNKKGLLRKARSLGGVARI